MVDLPLASPAPSFPIAATPSSAGGVTAVQVLITALPSTVEELLRAFQMSATPVVMSESTLVLVTELGNFKVSVAQQFGAAEKQSLAQQLLSFVQNQKPLTLTLQPGSPPTKGVLIMPSHSAAATAKSGACMPAVSSLPPTSLSIGVELRAVVLPTLVEAGGALDARKASKASFNRPAGEISQQIEATPQAETLAHEAVPLSTHLKQPDALVPEVKNAPIAAQATVAAPQPDTQPHEGAPQIANLETKSRESAPEIKGVPTVDQSATRPEIETQPHDAAPQIEHPTLQPIELAPEARSISFIDQATLNASRTDYNKAHELPHLGIQPQEPTLLPSTPADKPQVQLDEPNTTATHREPSPASPAQDQTEYFLPRIFKLSEPSTPPASARPLLPSSQSIIALQEIPVPTSSTFSVPSPLQAIPPAALAAPVADPPELQQKTASGPSGTPHFFASDGKPPPATTSPTPPVQKPPIEKLLVPGNEVSLRVERVFVERTDAEISPPLLKPDQILATVSGFGTDGKMILKASDATLFVKTQVTAPVGTSVVLSIDALHNDPLTTVEPPEILNFRALPQALAALEQISPKIFHNVVSTFLPQPTESLTGALLFLLSAIKKGNVRDWFGEDAVETLKSAGKSSIINSLSKDLSAAGQKTQDPVVGEWKSYPIPLYANHQFQELALHVHSDRDARKDKGAPGIGKIRFLIDVRLSKLGSMQIDGFVLPKKLDMVLRSENVLPDGLHQELRSAYAKALEAVGYAGSLHFQVGRQHWMVLAKGAPQGIVT